MPRALTSLPARLAPAVLLLGCHSVAAAEPLAASIPEVAAIVKARDDFRGLVVQVKERYKPSDPEYLQARRLYGEAYGRYDAWTTLLVTGIVAGSRPDLRANKSYQEVVNAAGLAGAQLSHYVEGALGPTKGTPIVTTVVELGIKLWLAWRDRTFNERKEVADYLAGRAKWDTWEAIKAEKESPPEKPSAGEGAAGSAQRDGLPPPSPTERWALVAGVGAYDDPYIQPLHGDADAVAFASALRDHAGFPGDHIVLLAGQDASDCHLGATVRAREQPAASESPSRTCIADRANLVNHLYRITKLVPANALFVFYFSGHGRFVDGEDLLYTADLRYGADSYVKQQGVSAAVVAEALHGNHTKQVLIFLDACRNQFLVTKGGEDERTSPQFSKGFDLDRLNANVEAYMTFFSSGADSASYEDPRAHRSYFTSELVRALDGDAAARDPRNLLTLGSLIHYVQTRVKARVAAERRGASQVPDVHLRGFLADELVLSARP
jgi:uncharacterized caspase-like protein